MELVQGSRLGERFKVIGCLGTDDLGPLFIAEDATRNNSLVTIKVLQHGLKDDNTARDRIRARIEAHVNLKTPHIVRLLEFVEQYGFQAFVMEYVEGVDLAEFISHKALGIKDALHILRQVAEVLEEMHSKQLIHGELRLSNIIINDKGNVQLLDYGVPDLGKRTRLTTESSFGRGLHQPPELIKFGTYSVQGDLYSLGVLGYELVSPADARLIKELVAKATCFDSEQRYDDIEQIINDLGCIYDRIDSRVVMSGTLFITLAALYIVMHLAVIFYLYPL